MTIGICEPSQWQDNKWLTYRADFVDIYHDDRTGTRVPLFWRDEVGVLFRPKLVDSS